MEDSVDAYWHPLTPEHGFPSLSYKTQGAPPQPAAKADSFHAASAGYVSSFLKEMPVKQEITTEKAFCEMPVKQKIPTEIKQENTFCGILL